MLKKFTNVKVDSQNAQKAAKIIAIVVDPKVSAETVTKFLEALGNADGCQILYKSNPNKITTFRTKLELDSFLSGIKDV